MLEAKRIVVDYIVEEDGKDHIHNITISYRVDNGVAKFEGDQKQVQDIVWLLNNAQAKSVKAVIHNGN